MRDWHHENHLRELAGHPTRGLCPECHSPTKTEPGDTYAPRVRSCARCGWDDYDDQLREWITHADESALYGDAHGSDI